MKNPKHKARNPKLTLAGAKVILNGTKWSEGTKRSFIASLFRMTFGRFRVSEKRGFTLIETIVALSLITAAVVGPVFLITKGLYSASFSKNRLIASNLAQEGIESARAVRENNMICGFLNSDPNFDWLRGSDGSGRMAGSGLTVDTTQFYIITCNGQIITNPQIRSDIGCSNILKMDTSGHYGYIGTNSTVFTRCLDVTPASSDDGIIPKADIADITSTVNWNERGQNNTFVVKERLYNWK